MMFSMQLREESAHGVARGLIACRWDMELKAYMPIPTKSSIDSEPKASTGSGRSRPPVPGEAGAYKNGNHLTPGLAEVSASGCGLHLLSPGEDFTWFHPAEGSLAAGLIAQAPVKRSDLVVEIGPGRGILTRELARRCREVVAVEFDGALSEALRTRFPSDDRVTIVRSDFLRFRLPDVPYKVLGNIPFNRTAAIVRRLVQAGSPAAGRLARDPA